VPDEGTRPTVPRLVVTELDEPPSTTLLPAVPNVVGTPAESTSRRPAAFVSVVVE
jgi:hypothetical protein